MANAIKKDVNSLVPSKMASRKQWVVWKYVQKDGKDKPDKMPYTMQGKMSGWQNISSLTHGNYEEAVKFKSKGGYDGIGFVFTKDDPFVFIDLDNCFEGDEPNQLAQRVLELAGNTYAEVSPSGKGLHIFGIGKLEKALKPVHGKFEVYSHGRFSTVTEEGVENGGLLGDIQPAIDYLQGLDNEQRKRSPSNANNLTIIKGSRNNSLYQEMCRFYMLEAQTKEDFTPELKERGLDYAFEFVNGKMSEPLETQEVHKVNDNAFKSCDEGFDSNKKSQTRGAKKDKATYQDYIELLKATYPDKKPRKDLVSGKLMIFNREQWCSVATKGGNVLYELSSITRDDNFYIHSALIDHYKRYEFSLDGELLLDIEAWDGTDRLRVLTDCLSAECFTKDQVYELIVDWLVNAYRKALNPETQNRVLLLQGEQGAGKDKFNSVLSAIFSGSKWAPNREVTSGYISNLTIKPNMAEEDWARAMCSSVIVNVSEFDKIKGGQAIFKSIVTASTASWTPKYVEDLTTRLVRASIIASMNPKDINADPSGARRYLVIELKGKPHDQCKGNEVPAIRWEYEKVASETEQLLAQVVHMSQKWAGLSQSTLNALKEVQARLTPIDEVEAAIEDIFGMAHDKGSKLYEGLCLAQTEQVKIGGKQIECKFLKNQIIGPLLDEIAESYGVSSKAIRGRLKNSGYGASKKIGGITQRGFYIPNPNQSATSEPTGEEDLGEDIPF